LFGTEGIKVGRGLAGSAHLEVSLYNLVISGKEARKHIISIERSSHLYIAD
jgi:hypothetical protein